jgi:nicotinamide N-methyltransferase
LFATLRHQGVYITSRLRYSCPLQGHLLWNAGRTLATHLEINASSLIHDKTILELGAGAGLPSLVSAIHGAKCVVVTDYPDPDLVENLQWNVDNCAFLPKTRNIEAKGYLWGAETEKLVSGLPHGENRFDLLILADLLFNHSEHRKLVASVQQMLKRTPEAKALVFFTPYRPWLLPNDLAFFDLAKEAGFEVDKFFEHTMEKVMFEEDPGVSPHCVAKSYKRWTLILGPGRAASSNSIRI